MVLLTMLPVTVSRRSAPALFSEPRLLAFGWNYNDRGSGCQACGRLPEVLRRTLVFLTHQFHVGATVPSRLLQFFFERSS